MKKVAGKFGQTENCVYFCTRISAKGSVLSFKKDRDLAQLVAHTSGGREVAGSSPVIPTEERENRKIPSLFLFWLFEVGGRINNACCYLLRSGSSRRQRVCRE